MKTKIIATVGPKTESKENLRQLIESGADIIRVNFSHATHDQYRSVHAIITEINRELNKDVKILQDLQGPRIRVGEVPAEGILLAEDEVYTFSYAKKTDVANQQIHLDDPYLHIDMKVGEPFYLVNGAIELVVTDIADETIHAKVVRGGTLYSRKGINVPKTNLQRGGLTEEDIEDVKMAIAVGVDYIALSFVQSAEDLKKLKHIVGETPVKLIAKIERALALENIDEIIKYSDGIMVARGDLGIEVPLEDVPIIQKNLVRHAHWHGKPVIIATQMMMSMMDHDHPTRA